MVPRWLWTVFVLTMVACGTETPPAERPVPAAKPPAPRPGTGINVVLITLDTVRADHLGPYGYAEAKTPTLDQLAKEGIVFEKAYSQVPLTIPSHSSIMTGTWPFHHGVRDNGDHFLSEKEQTLAESLKGFGYHTGAATAAYVTSRTWGFGQGFDYYGDNLKMGEQKGNNLWRVERGGAEVVDDALGWLSQVSGPGQQQPFFLWLHLFDAHSPYTPPEPQRSEFKAHPYDGEIAYLDSQLRRLTDALAQSGQLQKTLVVVMADHGESLGEHGEETHGLLIYDSTTHIPLIVRLPGAEHKGTRIAQPVGTVDVMPTILEYAGIAIPASVQGQSLKPAIEGQKLPDRLIYSESFYARYHYGWHELQTVTDGQHRYIETSRPELYDRHADPEEKTNLLPGQDGSLWRQNLGQLVANGTPKEGTHAQAADLDEEQMERLRALGYVGAVGIDSGAGGGELPDIKDKLPVLKKLRQAQAALAKRPTGADLDKVIQVFKDVVKEEPGQMDAQLTLANLLSRQGRLTEALDVLRAARTRAPTQSLLAQAEASVLSDMGRSDEALQSLDQVLSIDPRSRAAYAQKCEILLKMTRYDEVIAVGTTALLTAGEDQPRIHVAMGAAWFQKTSPRQANEHLTRAVELRYDTPWVHHWLGVLAFATGRNDQAVEQLREEVAFYPGHRESYQELARIYAALKMTEQHIGVLEVLLEGDPRNPLLLHGMGQARFNQGRYEEALEYAQLCVKTKPDMAEGWLLLANSLSKTSQRDKALEAFEEAKRLAGQK